MPQVTKTPKPLRPYLSLGLSLDIADEQSIGDCPFCGRGGKFSVNSTTGQFRCWVCAAGTDKGGGNEYTFLRLVWERSDKSTTDYDDLSEERGLLNTETPMYWGACRSILTDQWLVPGYNAQGHLVQLYRWMKDYQSGKMRLLATEGLPHGMFVPKDFEPTADEVLICEGPWDAMALWELSPGPQVVAVPGCNVFSESWLPAFAGKVTTLLYDNDHPREVNGKTVEGGGYAGTKRASKLLGSCSSNPKVRWLKWGRDGYDPSLPHGYDVRDWVKNGQDQAGRLELVAKLLRKTEPVPAEWLVQDKVGAEESGLLEPLTCTSWTELTNSWRKAFKWPEPGVGLDLALSVMLAAASSVMVVHDQLWVKIMSPPSTGKSALAEALSVARQYAKAVSTFKGFYSGYQEDKDGKGKNYSLIEQLDGKAFIVKDGDTLLTLPNRSQVLGQGRDLYDTVGRSQYNNKMSKDWHNKRFAWILCGTKSLRALDHSELGQRFLDCRIMDVIDEEWEGEIGWRKINQVRNARHLVDGKPDTTDTAEMIEAKRLTGGYLKWLRENMEELYLAVEMSDEAARKCVVYGQFVAYLRARPSKVQEEEEAGREMSARLITQFGKLALCLAVVLNRKSVDGEVMGRVRQVALDTAQGRTYQIIKKLQESGEVGLTAESLGIFEGETAAKERQLLHFLRKLGAVSWYRTKVSGIAPRVKWRLTPLMESLYSKVVG